MNRWDKIWQPKSVVVVFIHFESGQRTLHAGKFGKEPIKSEVNQFDSIEAVVKHFGASIPIHLHLSGTGVLSRKIATKPSYASDLVISGNPEEFMFSTFDDGVSMAVSFCRISLIESELEDITTQKWHLNGITCGDSILFSVLDNEAIAFDLSLEIKDGRIRSYNRVDNVGNQTKWRGENWKKNELVGHAIAIQLEGNHEGFTSYGDTYCEEKRVNFRQFNQFRTIGVGVIGIIFLSLIVNYFYQNHLNQEIAQLETDLSIHNENLSMLDRLKQEKERKQQLITNSGVSTTQFSSYYLDQIGESVPSRITLSKMQVFPLSGKLKDKRKVEVDQNQISVFGQTKGNEVLDNWIEKMDRFSWVHSVELTNYLKSSDNYADFELIIRLGE